MLLASLLGCSSDDGQSSTSGVGPTETGSMTFGGDGDGDGTGDGDGDSPGDGDGDPASGDGDGDMTGDGDGEGEDECIAPEVQAAPGTETWMDSLGVATVASPEVETCQRSYSLSTTAELRDDLPANPRAFAEQPGWPTLRSGHLLFDALYALALEEVRECSVDAISDGAFNEGAPVECGVGGCFETGRLWKYVWTRDIAYAVDLGLAALDPARARNSLEFKLSERREGGDLQIVQDTGTGGSYPVSSDRVVWAFGARRLLASLEGDARTAFAASSLEALRNTVAHDRAVVFDPGDGLYRGEQSFLDWREQSYPDWTAEDVVHIGMSKALSTNLGHLAALELLAELATEAGEDVLAAEAQGWAGELRTAIRSELWLPELGQFATYKTTGLDPSPVHRYDLLGAAHAILLEVAEIDEAAQMLAGYPVYGPGAPVFWPQQQFTPIYHNRGEWPFVTAYWLRAAAHGESHNPAVASRMMRALIRGAALNLSNMENFEAFTGAPWVEEGDTSGPVVNSQRQLWSVAGYVSFVHQTLFGLEPTSEGLRVHPYLPSELRSDLFGTSDRIALNGYPFRGLSLDVVLELPEDAGTGALEVVGVRVDGEVVDGEHVPAEQLGAGSLIEVELAAGARPAGSIEIRDVADYREIFGPRTPSITSLANVGGQLRLSFGLAGEQSADLRLDIYRDGALVAADLPGDTTEWLDPESDAAAASSPCYSVATRYASGNVSQHAPPACWWGPNAERITAIGAGDLQNVGGEGIVNYGRFHYQGWGAPGHSLTAPSFTPTQSGRHRIQVIYGNGAGAISTGITAAVKRVRVIENGSDIEVGSGVLVMPQLGTWDRWEDSNFVELDLDAGVEYRIVIDQSPETINMSSLSHFETYTAGLGGTDGAFNDVNIAELLILAG